MSARPFICLKCQSRLARRIPSRVHVAFQSTSAKPSHYRRRSPEGYKAEQPTRQSFTRPTFLQQPADPYTNSQEKLYGHAGRKQHGDRERLEIDSLGIKADVIVLRDTKVTTYTHYKTVKTAEQPAPIDILAELDNQRGLVGQKEVDENINHFRPKEGEEPQDRDEFNRLVQDIQAGFTVSQLARYIQNFSRENEKESTADAGSLIPRVSPWMPETSASTEELDDESSRGYSLASYTSKQRLVLRLIRECWRLELPELEDGVGEVELELKPDDYELLLKGPRSFLGRIAVEHIKGEDERIDGFRSRHTIRITTTRAKSELIVSEIEQALRNIRRKTVSLDNLVQPDQNTPRQLQKWADVHFDTPTIRELGRMTQTDIQVLPKKKLLISSIGHKPGSLTSNNVDIAVRLLVTSDNFSNRTTTWLGYKEVPEAPAAAFIKYTAVDGLGWRDRLRQWTRWTAPVAKISEVENGQGENDVAESAPSVEPPTKLETSESAAVVNEGTEPKQQDPVEIVTSNSETELEGDFRWQNEYHADSSALIGSVLHSSSDNSAPPSALQPFSKTPDTLRAFSTAVPNLSTFLGSKAARAIRRKPVESLVMRFQPNPFFHPPKTSHPIGAAALSAFPPIEIRFSIDRASRELEFKDIRAVVSLDNSDLMLPGSAVDVRYQQRYLSRLEGGQVPPSVAEFLDNSDLDLREGRLDTPPKLTIPIAAHLCGSPGFDLLGEREDSGGVQDVEYLFAGIEVRKKMVLEYEGWRMLYTSIEAGKAGGRRGELRLLPTRTKRFGHTESQEEFVQTAHKLADTLSTGKVQPRDKVRRVALEVSVVRRVASSPANGGPEVYSNPKVSPGRAGGRGASNRAGAQMRLDRTMDDRIRELKEHFAKLSQRPRKDSEDDEESS